MRLRSAFAFTALLAAGLCTSQIQAQDLVKSVGVTTLEMDQRALAGHLPDFKIITVRREVEEPGIVFWYVTLENAGAGYWPYEANPGGGYKVKLPSIAVKYYAPKSEELSVRGETDTPPFILHFHNTTTWQAVNSLSDLVPGKRFDVILRAPSSHVNYVGSNGTAMYLYFTANWDRSMQEETSTHLIDPAYTNNTFRW